MRHSPNAYAIAGICISSLLTACNNPEHWSWKEEVRLSDGSVIQVERTAHRNNVWPNLGGGGYRSVVDQSFLYRIGGSGNIAWNQNEDPDRLRPLAFDRFGKRFFIAGTPDDPVPAHCLVNPKQYAVVFIARSPTGWAQVPQSNELLDTLQYNLIWDVSWGESTASEKPRELKIDQKTARAQHDFHSPISVREFLTKQKLTCADRLENAGHRELAKEARGGT